jgi:hypothetical protein
MVSRFGSSTSHKGRPADPASDVWTSTEGRIRLLGLHKTPTFASSSYRSLHVFHGRQPYAAFSPSCSVHLSWSIPPPKFLSGGHPTCGHGPLVAAPREAPCHPLLHRAVRFGPAIRTLSSLSANLQMLSLPSNGFPSWRDYHRGSYRASCSGGSAA